MITQDELQRFNEQMMDRMVRSGWLESYTFTDGKGFRLNWTPQGAERGILLKKIITTFHLHERDGAPYRFHKVAYGATLPGAPTLPEQVAGLWRQCVQELGCDFTADELQVFVHIIVGWAPGQETQMKFGD